MSSYAVEKKSLYVPPLQEVADILKKGLSKNFTDVCCEVVECPDLSQLPWGLADKGLCGSPRIGEVGGVRFLAPFAQKEKVYDFRDIAKQIDLPEGLIIGAGAGPHNYVGVNSEIIPNLKTGKGNRNESRIAKVSEEGCCVLSRLPEDETRCAILLNFFACAGKGGPVIKVSAKKRTGSQDFVGCMRQSLDEEYDSRIVGMGGTFIMKSGTAKIHVMPDFSKEPLKSEADVNKWLRFYDMKAPMVFMSVFVSRDPGLEFRVEHTHGYSSTEGGHYHFDITPEVVEYEGYFNIADLIFRLDKP